MHNGFLYTRFSGNLKNARTMKSVFYEIRVFVVKKYLTA